ncbi:MAG: HlyD family efflux transporter periplasmic adaptor subunit [Lachnospiraceae bacterium]|nr:HlyD family efflux transporter periplasmic adaptor subunit [Lachnospiraceae bacterium]
MAKQELTPTERRAQRRKDLIKNILIVFLVVMLLLTFFSGTIQNWSLPEVATNRVEAATISPQIRGSGVVEADDPYNVVISQSRKVASVAVKVGDEVKKDDPIYRLEDTDSKELDEAVAALRKLETEYGLSLFGEGVTDSAIARARSGQTDSLDGYQAQLKNMNDRLLAATEEDNRVKSAIEVLEAEHKRILGELGAADTSSQDYQKATIEAEITKLTNAKTTLTAEISAQQSVMDAHLVEVEDPPGSGKKTTRPPTDTEAGYAEYDAAKKARDDAQTQLDGIDTEIAYYQIMLADLTRDASHVTTQNAQQVAAENRRYETELARLNAEKLQTAAALEAVQKEHDEFIANAKTEITLSASQQDIADARRTVEKLRESSVGAAVTSPVDGIISSLSYVAGQTIAPDETCAVIQVAGKAMALHFSVTNEQAKQLKVGDLAEPQNSWQYTQFKAQITAIKPDKEDPGNKKQLTVSIDSPEVSAGQTVSVKIGQASRTYEMTVPNSAIREDNNGKFILIIEEKASPLRNRYIARRADVEVVASDDTKTAINAPIEGWEYVITTSTAPISAGEEVRLASSSY